MSAPRVYLPGVATSGGKAVAGASARTVDLPDDEAHHLVRVLRLRDGADVIVFDGAGREWAGQLVTRGRAAAVEIGAERVPAPEPRVAVTLAIGVLKGDQMDTAVRDATALGVRRIVPIASAHVTVPERAWRSEAARARWTRVAVAAAKQCRRAVVPEIAAVAPFDACLAPSPGVAMFMAVEPAVGVERPVFHLRQGSGGQVRPAGSTPPAAVVLVGPEGGWSANEVARALDAGAEPIDLGPRTLRAELVPAVLLSSLWTRWGWR